MKYLSGFMCLTSFNLLNNLTIFLQYSFCTCFMEEKADEVDRGLTPCLACWGWYLPPVASYWPWYVAGFSSIQMDHPEAKLPPSRKGLDLSFHEPQVPPQYLLLRLL